MKNSEKTYRIGLGVAGGIAAYKAIEVLRALQKSGCTVRVAMTRHAAEFIQPLTFRALSGEYVLVDDYDAGNPDPIAHVNFSQTIDLLLIVPATANILGKCANGIADDFLTSTYLAANVPVMVAPAMNVSMWNHPATQRNIKKLKSDGIFFVEPVEGELACKTVGTGKLEDVENIVRQALDLLADRAIKSTHQKDLSGEKILITIGGTREAIDPVRFISNHSSGKMGFAIAAAASARGAEVTAVCGSTTAKRPDGFKIVNAVSAAEMYDAVMRNIDGRTVFIGAAAVADFRPANREEFKIKKTGVDKIDLDLEKTVDILAEVSARRTPEMLVIGFAAETNNVIAYARSKMEKKDLDMVVANDISRTDAGFNTDTNAATVLFRNGDADLNLPLMTKGEMANRILNEIVKVRRRKAVNDR